MFIIVSRLAIFSYFLFSLKHTVLLLYLTENCGLDPIIESFEIYPFAHLAGYGNIGYETNYSNLNSEKCMFNTLNMMIKLKYIHLAFLGLGMRDNPMLRLIGCLKWVNH